jgi:glycosyltransferase involved in cell wall biosynthesis
MKTTKNNLNVVYMGRYNGAEILSGPEKTAKRIFDLRFAETKTSFIQYFFDGRKFGLFKKLFGMDSVALNDNAKLYTAGLVRIIPLLFKLKPDLIHMITYERFEVIAIIFKLFSRVKIIFNMHGVIAYENSVIKKSSFFYWAKDRYCEWTLLKFSDKIVYHSETSIDIAQMYYNINESKAVILSHGIDEEFHLACSGKLANKSPIIKAVISNGSEYSTSGIHFLIKAFSGTELPVDLFIIGDKIDLVIANENLEIHYLNKMAPSALADFYKDKDVFLSLNDFETFSIASVEAMAAGLIPVVTAQTGMSRFIIDGENGYTIKYGDSEKLRDSLDKIAEEPELRNEINREASKIYTILSWPEIYESYRNLYESVCS